MRFPKHILAGSYVLFLHLQYLKGLYDHDIIVPDLIKGKLNPHPVSNMKTLRKLLIAALSIATVYSTECIRGNPAGLRP